MFILLFLGRLAQLFCHFTLTVKKTTAYTDSAKPKTIGNHIRKRRLNLGLSQHEVAKMIAVSDDTIRQWEKNVYKPLIRFYPKIIEFLTYVPLPKPHSFSVQLRFCRHALGITQKRFAQLVKYSSDTVSDEAAKSRGEIYRNN